MTVISAQTRFPEVASNFILWFKTWKVEVPGSPLPFIQLLFQLFIQISSPQRGVRWNRTFKNCKTSHPFSFSNFISLFIVHLLNHHISYLSCQQSVFRTTSSVLYHAASSVPPTKNICWMSKSLVLAFSCLFNKTKSRYTALKFYTFNLTRDGSQPFKLLGNIPSCRWSIFAPLGLVDVWVVSNLGRLPPMLHWTSRSTCLMGTWSITLLKKNSYLIKTQLWSQRHGFESWLCHLLTVSPWEI